LGQICVSAYGSVNLRLEVVPDVFPITADENNLSATICIAPLKIA
jgi:hypothetical protein